MKCNYFVDNLFQLRNSRGEIPHNPPKHVFENLFSNLCRIEKGSFNSLKIIEYCCCYKNRAQKLESLTKAISIFKGHRMQYQIIYKLALEPSHNDDPNTALQKPFMFTCLFKHLLAWSNNKHCCRISLCISD